jgi:hypothetical protein
MPGLDPGIHQKYEGHHGRHLFIEEWICRVKPGNDE